MTARSGRYFFALWPDEAARHALSRWVCASRQQVGGRSVRCANLHITLAFLGPLSAAQRRAVEDCAASVAMPALVVHLDRLGFWRRPGIVWAGSRTPPAALAEFAVALQGALRHRGFRLDERPYVPHVTLLRQARRRPRLELSAIDWPATGFSLVNSEQTDGGVSYLRVRDWSADEDMK